MRRSGIQPRFDFETIKTAINRWRDDHAPGLTRDEAARHILGEWLKCQGYILAETSESRAGNLVVTVISQRNLSGR